jgi:sterol desaturase/sphingolipid hydroxylase (fatty acid hydroxylase superfamily)
MTGTQTAGIVAGAAAFMFVAERLAPGRKWPRVGGWWARALFVNGFQALIAAVSAGLWDRRFHEIRPWSAEHLPLIAQLALGYLAITFVYYWWHRARHESGLLWRWFHQVHHSPQRIEVVTSFYKHPFEIAVNGVLSSAILYLLVGVSVPAAGLVVLITGLAELFYHWNVATPYWLGFLFQRPESHCVHHQEGAHSFNYSDLPLWDMLFGTFRNPKRWDARCGLGAANEPRLFAMLAGRDLSEGSPHS